MVKRTFFYIAVFAKRDGFGNKLQYLPDILRFMYVNAVSFRERKANTLLNPLLPNPYGLFYMPERYKNKNYTFDYQVEKFTFRLNNKKPAQADLFQTILLFCSQLSQSLFIPWRSSKNRHHTIFSNLCMLQPPHRGNNEI